MKNLEDFELHADALEIQVYIFNWLTMPDDIKEYLPGMWPDSFGNGRILEYEVGGIEWSTTDESDPDRIMGEKVDAYFMKYLPPFDIEEKTVRVLVKVCW